MILMYFNSGAVRYLKKDEQPIDLVSYKTKKKLTNEFICRELLEYAKRNDLDPTYYILAIH